jgi:uncharacterized alpha-E superfamily protein
MAATSLMGAPFNVELQNFLNNYKKKMQLFSGLTFQRMYNNKK